MTEQAVPIPHLYTPNPKLWDGFPRHLEIDADGVFVWKIDLPNYFNLSPMERALPITWDMLEEATEELKRLAESPAEKEARRKFENAEMVKWADDVTPEDIDAIREELRKLRTEQAASSTWATVLADIEHEQQELATTEPKSPVLRTTYGRAEIRTDPEYHHPTVEDKEAYFEWAKWNMTDDGHGNYFTPTFDDWMQMMYPANYRHGRELQ